jgi:membrane protein DedA with SNARE-associated domain
LDYSEFYGWLIGTFSSLVLAGMGFPIPEAGPVVAAGAWVGSRQGEFGIIVWLLLPACILGIVIADCILYTVGRLFGRRLFKHRLIAKILHADKQAKVEENFHKYGLKILLFARLLPSIPTVISITAGTMKVSFRRFVVADIIYAIPGISLLFILAFWFGQAIVDLVHKADEKLNAVGQEVRSGVASWFILAAILAVALYFLYRFYRRPITTGDPKDLPIIGEAVAAKMEHHGPDLAAPPNLPSSSSTNGTPSSPNPSADNTDTIPTTSTNLPPNSSNNGIPLSDNPRSPLPQSNPKLET